MNFSFMLRKAFKLLTMKLAKLSGHFSIFPVYGATKVIWQLISFISPSTDIPEPPVTDHNMTYNSDETDDQTEEVSDILQSQAMQW